MSCWLRRYVYFSHCLQWFSLSDVGLLYVGISPGISLYRTLAVVWTALHCNYGMVVIVWENINFVHFSCDMRKYSRGLQTQWIRCSSKGSHLIHWTSAVFSHFALKLTPFALFQYVWNAKAERDHVIFTHYSPDGDENYPGDVTVRVSLQLTDDNQIVVDVTAESPHKATPINVGWHPYFNLAGEVCIYFLY